MECQIKNTARHTKTRTAKLGHTILLMAGVVSLVFTPIPVEAADAAAREKEVLGEQKRSPDGERERGEQQLGSATTMVMDAEFGERYPKMCERFKELEAEVREDIARIDSWVKEPPIRAAEKQEALMVADRVARTIKRVSKEHREVIFRRLSVVTRHLAEESTDQFLRDCSRQLNELLGQLEMYGAISADIASHAEAFNKGAYRVNWSRFRRLVPSGVLASAENIVRNAARPTPGQTPAQAAMGVLDRMAGGLKLQLEDNKAIIEAAQAGYQDDERELLRDLYLHLKQLANVETTARNAEVVAFKRKMMELRMRRASIRAPVAP